MNPHNKTNFKQAHVDMKEGLYFSHKTKPLGQTHDQSKHLPPEVDASNTTFGKLVKRGLTFGEVVTPQKSVQQIDQEFMEGRELYKKVRHHAVGGYRGWMDGWVGLGGWG